jgi:hypothetical protein
VTVKLIYVIHRYRDENRHNQSMNTWSAYFYADLIKSAGHVPVVTQAMYAPWGDRQFNTPDGQRDSLDDHYWLEATRLVLRRCDGAIVVPPLSDGCISEICSCAHLGIPMLSLPSRSISGNWTVAEILAHVEHIRHWVDNVVQPGPVRIISPMAVREHALGEIMESIRDSVEKKAPPLRQTLGMGDTHEPA